MPRTASLAPRPRRTPPRGARGFALLITITLVAFLVLVLVALATLTRVETQVASNSQRQEQARQNALAALNIALGELQKYAGPDQRSTATADIVSGNDGTRSWTGVWGNAANPQTSAASAPVLLQWLVSGNHGTAFSPDAAVAATTDAFGQILAAPPAHAHVPTAVTGLAAGQSPLSPLKIDGEDAALLVGPGSAGDIDTTGYVAAPLVDITASPGDVPGQDASGPDVTVGRYAYWIGDESVKARLDAVDPYVTPTAAMDAGGTKPAPASPLRLMAPQRLGIERVDGFGQYPANDLKLRNLLTAGQADLLVPGLTPQARKAAFHDLTTASRSVLADQLRGGLKRDLTHAFARDDLDEYRAVIRDPWRTLSTDKPNPLLSGALAPGASDVTLAEATLLDDQGPTWEQLRDHARLGAEIDASGRIAPRIQTGTTQGVWPILVQARLGFPGGKTVDGSTTDHQRFVFRVSPVFVLANPHNVAIAASKYRVRAVFDTSGGGFGVYLASKVNETVRTPIWRKTLRELFDGQVYELNCPELAPGEARLFTLAQDEPWASKKVYQFDPEWAQTIITLDDPSIGTEVTDAEIMAEGLAAAFSDNGIQDSWRDNGTLSSVGATDGSMTWVLSDGNDRIYQRISLLARGSGASVYDGGFRVPTADPADDPQINGYLMLKLSDTGNFTANGSDYTELSPVHLYPYYALANLRAPLIARTGWFQSRHSPSVYGAVSYEHSFQKSANDLRFRSWFRFGSSDPFTEAKVEWQGVRRDSSLGTSSTSLPQALMRWPMADIPRAPDGKVSGLVSLGQLQHFNAGGFNDGQIFPTAAELIDTPTVRPSVNSTWRPRHVAPPNPIGNSRATPYVRRDLVRNRLSSEPYYDQSYLLNRQLFDGYFFSTYPQDTGRTVDLGVHRLANSALHPFRPEIAANDTSAYRGHDATFDPNNVFLPARNLLLQGGFNVNSTSVAAWRALLGSLAGTTLNGETGLTGPFPRSIRQAGGSASADDGVSFNYWNGFRDLSPAQIDTLAEQIVTQIRQRGPAVGLADFINRKLVADTAADAALGLAGPLQAAIDAAGLNDNVAKEIQNWNAEPIDLTTPDSGHPLYAHPAHLPRSPLEGAAGWLSQADLVQALTPLMTARGDTFRIRAYGESRNPATDDINGRAWCEAIVQRFPDYVAPTANDAIEHGPALSPENRRFGRKFVVIGFRWLQPDEI